MAARQLLRSFTLLAACACATNAAALVMTHAPAPTVVDAVRPVAPLRAVALTQGAPRSSHIVLRQAAPRKNKASPSKRGAPAARDGKITGLTSLAPLKAYLLAAALVWAVVGSVTG